MKVFIVLSAIVACALAEGYEGGHYAAAPIASKVVNVNTGHSTQSRKQDAGGNYAFGYDASWSDAWGHNSHSRRESGDGWGNKEGSYSLNIGDGRSRLVKYVADGHGFRASIKTNEPGIVASNPAAASINTPHGHDLAIAPIATATAVGGYSDGGYAGGLGGGALLGGGLAGGYAGGLAGGYGEGLASGYAGGLAGGYAGGLGGGALLGGGYGGAYGGAGYAGGLGGGLAGGYAGGLAGGHGY